MKVFKKEFNLNGLLKIITLIYFFTFKKKTEDIPEKNDEGVRVLVGKNF